MIIEAFSKVEGTTWHMTDAEFFEHVKVTTGSEAVQSLWGSQFSRNWSEELSPVRPLTDAEMGQLVYALEAIIRAVDNAESF